jgi:hypothetical protein
VTTPSATEPEPVQAAAGDAETDNG